MLDVAGKRIHVIGLGAKGTGRACTQVLGKLGAQITISDAKTPAELAGEVAKLGDASVRLQFGPGEAYADLEAADLIVPSPGVPLAIPPIVAVLGLANLGFVVGIAWLRHITRVEDEGDDPWRFRR
jgi:UDP-N-acetylmuramoylalanine--D-glutamate ligase